MWETSKLTEKEFDQINIIQKAIHELNRIESNAVDFFEEKDVSMNELSDVSIDIVHDELFLAIKRFKEGETKVMAVEVPQNTGFHLVEVLEHHYDYAFGFREDKDGKTFYLCETHDNWSEACEEGHYFSLGDEDFIIALHDCVRVRTYI